MKNFDKKFANFFEMCHALKADGCDTVIIAFPSLIGDNYQEIVESLSRLAEIGLKLQITHREPFDPVDFGGANTDPEGNGSSDEASS